jgi:hypothetical protein
VQARAAPEVAAALEQTDYSCVLRLMTVDLAAEISFSPLLLLIQTVANRDKACDNNN